MLVGYLKAESNALSSSIEEMEMLSRTAGFLIAETVTQCIDSPGYVTYLGSGKIESVASLISKSNAEAVITRHNLKPAQVSTLEKTLGTSVLDRTQL
ncbi:MAG: GTPase HflX, partial [Thermotogales bacterium 46_20]